MTSSKDLHRQAMDLVTGALALKAKADFSGYVRMMKQALPLETAAAELMIDELDAEPTRSVLFLGAANIAWACRDTEVTKRMITLGLKGNAPLKMTDDLIRLLQDVTYAERTESDLSPERFHYLDALRDKALNIRIKAKTGSHSDAVILRYGTHTLNKIDASWSAFVMNSYVNTFAIDATAKDALIIPALVRKDAPMLIANLTFRSFGVSLVSDTCLMSQSVVKKQQRWRETLFDEFKDDVFNVDYQSTRDRSRILRKFSDEQRRESYGPILPLMKESNGFAISILDKEFNPNTERVLRPVDVTSSSELTPPATKPEPPEKVLTKAVYFSNPNSTKVSERDFIDKEELDYLAITRRVSLVESSSGSLRFQSELEIPIVYERPYFSINDHRFGLSVQDKEISAVMELYAARLVQMYDALGKLTEAELTEDQRRIIAAFASVVRTV